MLQTSETPVSETLSSSCSEATFMNLERVKILLSCSLNKEEFGREYMISPKQHILTYQMGFRIVCLKTVAKKITKHYIKEVEI